VNTENQELQYFEMYYKNQEFCIVEVTRTYSENGLITPSEKRRVCLQGKNYEFILECFERKLKEADSDYEKSHGIRIF
jgi:hypothetical protein